MNVKEILAKKIKATKCRSATAVPYQKILETAKAEVKNYVGQLEHVFVKPRLAGINFKCGVPCCSTVFNSIILSVIFLHAFSNKFKPETKGGDLNQSIDQSSLTQYYRTIV